jgi:hypothetical protein
MQFFFPKFVILFSVIPTAINDFADEFQSTRPKPGLSPCSVTQRDLPEAPWI